LPAPELERQFHRRGSTTAPQFDAHDRFQHGGAAADPSHRGAARIESIDHSERRIRGVVVFGEQVPQAVSPASIVTKAS